MPQARGEGRLSAWTFIEHVRADGVVVRRESRRHRKHLSPATGSTWWAPQARGWWIAILFAVGSVLFAIGSVPAYISAVGTRSDAVTYFAGSVFFTCAAFLSYREAVDAGYPVAAVGNRRFFVFRPHRIDWWATVVQLAGTLFFNLSTGAAIVAGLTAQAAHQHVWRPDAVGSVCFLVASALAWVEVCHGWAAWRPWLWSWRVTLANLLGSVAFGVAAAAGYISPSSGQVRNADWAELTTLAGAACFFAGALMLLPERTEEVERAAR